MPRSRACNAVFDEAQEIFNQKPKDEEDEASSSDVIGSASCSVDLVVNPVYDDWSMLGVHTKSNISVERSTDQLSTQSSESFKSWGARSFCTSTRRRPIYDLSIHNLSYKVNVNEEVAGGKDVKKKVLLNRVNARANHSEVLAIIGRSGSSKSTLLDALAGRIDSRCLEGCILLNGKRMDDGLKSISGYVMQEDNLFPMLTVKETLMFSARLRVPNKVSQERKKDRVNALVEELGLTSCCDTRVGNEKVRGISGGEKRRLSIGVDVIHDPPVLLLDEPTSGLDSTSALQVMETLFRLAVKRRHTVVLTVHQPSFRMLDTIHNTLVLVKGSVVYHGHSSGMVDHFTSLKGLRMPDHVNVVEYALDTIAEFEKSSDGLNKLVAHERARMELFALPEDASNPEPNPQLEQNFKFPIQHRRRRYPTSFLSELMVLSERNLYNIFRTHTLFLTRVGVTVVTSLILVSLYCRSPISPKGIVDRQVFMVFTVAILVFTSTEALPILLLERQIFLREISRGAYRTSSYALSHAIVGQPFLVVLAVICTSLSYFAVGLATTTSAVFFFALVIFLVLSMSNAYVAMVSTLAPNFTVALAVVGGTTSYMFLFSGFFKSRNDLPVYWLWLHYLSLFKYPYESLLANEFLSRPRVWRDEGIDSSELLRHLAGGKVNQVMNVGIMIAFVIVYRLIFYVALRIGAKTVRR